MLGDFDEDVPMSLFADMCFKIGASEAIHAAKVVFPFVQKDRLFTDFAKRFDSQVDLFTILRFKSRKEQFKFERFGGQANEIGSGTSPGIGNRIGRGGIAVPRLRIGFGEKLFQSVTAEKGILRNEFLSDRICHGNVNVMG